MIFSFYKTIYSLFFFITVISLGIESNQCASHYSQLQETSTGLFRLATLSNSVSLEDLQSGRVQVVVEVPQGGNYESLQEQAQSAIETTLRNHTSSQSKKNEPDTKKPRIFNRLLSFTSNKKKQSPRHEDPFAYYHIHPRKKALGQGGFAIVHQGKISRKKNPNLINRVTTKFAPKKKVAIKITNPKYADLEGPRECEMSQRVARHDALGLFLRSTFDAERKAIVMEDLSENYINLLEYMNSRTRKREIIGLPKELQYKFQKYQNLDKEQRKLAYRYGIIKPHETVTKISFDSENQRLVLSVLEVDADIRAKLREQFYGTYGVLHTLKNAGIQHGDITPKNVMINPKTGAIKIIDFGLAVEFGKLNFTRSDINYDPQNKIIYVRPHVLGTPGFMSPQLTSRQPAGPEQDAFSVEEIFKRLDNNIPPDKSS